MNALTLPIIRPARCATCGGLGCDECATIRRDRVRVDGAAILKETLAAAALCLLLPLCVGLLVLFVLGAP